jgi:hypothetical protein
MVYFFAGVAKLNYDWLFRAMPLRIWLPPHIGLTLIGPLMDETWVAYAFSWFGAGVRPVHRVPAVGPPHPALRLRHWCWPST